MLTRIFACLLFITSSTALMANWAAAPVPVNVDLDKANDKSFPPLYYIADNCYRFNTGEKIVSLQVDTTRFTVKAAGKNIFTIGGRFNQCRRLDSLQTRLTFTFRNGSTRSFNVKLVPYPPVKVLFLDSNLHPLDISDGKLNYSGRVTCKSEWSLPNYCITNCRIDANIKVQWAWNSYQKNLFNVGPHIGSSDGSYNISPFTAGDGIAALIDNNIRAGAGLFIFSDYTLSALQLDATEPSRVEFVTK